ncbi:tryptophan--tRNA ligase, chloroplastic/mitochondrial-like isoform X3 [Durio zibethinus]|uniref:tryptophan--tRNA ligase n=1 Tax=Durio zibethinus TaxID=66656 RepID=A0A6P5ZQF0_DURZI|nr:tryptophan--tRNA ligase, chloroplastic/mitochondrial-like isoform X3 [Durio zibethinus]
MGRAVLSQFLILSNSSPRLSSSLSCGGLQSKYLKRPGFIRPAVNGDNGAGFRCCCSVSLSQPAVPETSSSSVRKRIVSGVQPTGAIHLGNYLGAIKNWINLQDLYDTLFFIVDLHAITLPYDTQELSKATRNTAAIYLACGVDTSKASVFVQSHVRAHVELMWLLSSATPIGWLNRMIQFKEKSRKAGDENVGVALLTYPVLMASDILLYQSDFVPVGEDQKQHLELTRELAERINYLYGGRKWKKLGGRGGAIFKVPEPLIPPAGARVMSLSDGLSKEVVRECQDMNWGTFKTLLTDSLVDHLHPIQARYEEIISDSAYLDGVLEEGAVKAAAIADATLNNVYQAMGFLRRRMK